MPSITQNINRIKRTIVLLLTIILTTYYCESAPFTIVIDAGHGGKDGGAAGTYSNEKDINLAVAKLLGKEILSTQTDVKIEYTRSTDTFVTIKGRMDKAKAVKADLFISLHCNSAAFENPRRTSLSGTSVYVLGMGNANDNIDLAMRENSAILLEDNYTTTYKGFDNSPEYYIFTEINQSKMMGKSNSVAGEVQRSLVANASLKDNHVNETSRLWLLLHSTMPAILIEMDYLCNPDREKFLNSDDGQRRIASAISTGIANYRKSLGHKPFDDKAKTVSSPSPQQSIAPQEATSQANCKTEAEPNNDKIVYKIQFYVSDSVLKSNASQLKGISPADYYQEGRDIKYTFGAYDTPAQAAGDLRSIKQKFPDAFIIKTQNNKRIR